MLGLFISFVASFLCTLIILRLDRMHNKWSGDSDFTSPQKIHKIITPRIGGISIVIGILLSTIASALKQEPKTWPLFMMCFCSLPCFLIGLIEDLTKTVPIKTRLFFTTISAILATHFLNAYVLKLDVPIIDTLLSNTFAAAFFTYFAIVGLANAYNIIDGFNGLSSMVALMSLSALLYVAVLVGDPVIGSLALVMIGAIIGFFIWNYPRGLIFLGDGGSYLIGFWIAVLSILLTARHTQISPWFALMINGYPVFETIFTIYRRKIHQRKNLAVADGIHFHTLIFRRFLRQTYSNQSSGYHYAANSKTSPYLWILSGCAVMPAIFFWDSTKVLILFAGLFVIIYISLYKSIIRFKTPKWLSLR